MENNNNQGLNMDFESKGTPIKKVLMIIIIGLIILFGLFYFFSMKKGSDNLKEGIESSIDENRKQTLIYEYILQNLGRLSEEAGYPPKGEMTIIENSFFDDGQTGVIKYFNGEKNLVGTYKYSFEEMTNTINVTDFTVNELEEQKG